MTLEDLKELADGKVPVELAFGGNCHDCGEEVKVVVQLQEGDKVEMCGGVPYRVEMGNTGQKQIFLKCIDCFEKEKALRNWQKCEVYSRVVGYLRPTSQWNKGKKTEFQMRKVLNI